MHAPAMLSLREAARLLGVSASSVRRRIREGTLPAERVTGPFGEQWMIPVASLHGPEAPPGGPSSGPGGPLEGVGEGEAPPERLFEICGGGVDGAGAPPVEGGAPSGWGWSPSRNLRGGGPPALSGGNGGGVPERVFTDVLERLLRTERQNEALLVELRQHRLVLEENARSIVEREAAAREAEARLEETRKALEEAAAQAQELQALRERATADAAARQRSEAELATARRRLEELEPSRRRPWWRRLFGLSS